MADLFVAKGPAAGGQPAVGTVSSSQTSPSEEHFCTVVPDQGHYNGITGREDGG